MIEGIEYSVPVEYRLRKIEYYKTEDNIYIFDIKTNKEIASHFIPRGTEKKVFNRMLRYKSLDLN